MKPSRRRIPASVFKARCLALLDDVQATRETLVVTKRGRPVAMVVAVPERPAARSLRGSVRYLGDIVAPIGDDWDALR